VDVHTATAAKVYWSFPVSGDAGDAAQRPNGELIGIRLWHLGFRPGPAARDSRKEGAEIIDQLLQTISPGIRNTDGTIAFARTAVMLETVTTGRRRYIVTFVPRTTRFRSAAERERHQCSHQG